MFCRYCGSSNEDNAKFCRKCGKDITINRDSAEKSIESDIENSIDNNTERNNESRKKYLIIAIAALAFILVVGIGVTVSLFFINLNNDGESPKKKNKNKNEVVEEEIEGITYDNLEESETEEVSDSIDQEDTGDETWLEGLSGELKTDEIKDMYIKYINNEIPDSDGIYFEEKYGRYIDVYYYFIKSKYAEYPALVINYNDAIVQNNIYYYSEGKLELKAYFGRQAVSGSILVDDSYIVFDFMPPCMCTESVITMLDENYDEVLVADIIWEGDDPDVDYHFHEDCINGYELDDDITDGISYLIKNGYISDDHNEYYGVDETEGRATLAMSVRDWQVPYREILEKQDDYLEVYLLYTGNDYIPKMIFGDYENLYMYSIIDGELVENKFEQVGCHSVFYCDGYIYLDGFTGLGGAGGRFSYDDKKGFRCDIYGSFSLDEDEEVHYSEYINYRTGEKLSGEEEYIFQKVNGICCGLYDGTVEAEEIQSSLKKDLLNTWYY